MLIASPMATPILSQRCHGTAGNRNTAAERLPFTTNHGNAVPGSDAVMIAAGTPSSSSGDADLTAVRAALGSFAPHLDAGATVVMKSTVPVGTADRVKAEIEKVLEERGKAVEFDVAIPFEAMRERFGRNVESSSPAQGFLSGGVTFCELVPLRAIPFRVVTLIGMGAGPWAIGMASELLSERFGVESLRYALLIGLASNPVGALCYLLAGRSLRKDIEFAAQA